MYVRLDYTTYKCVIKLTVMLQVVVKHLYQWD